MSLDDAIILAEDMARINEVEAKVHKAKGHIGSEYTCIGVAEHHRQVAEWLRELKGYREARQELEERHAVGTLDLIDSYIEGGKR